MMIPNTVFDFEPKKDKTGYQSVHVKTWDEHRNNPTAEVVLVSRDRIGFRVEAWYISKQSPVVKRHVESAKSAGTPVPFILLKQNGNVVRQFIECVTSSLSHEIDLPNRGVRDMWDLCVTLRATVIQYVALRALLARPGGTDLLGNFDPWEAFKVAATRDDLELAKLSIKAFDRAIIPISEILTTKPPSFFNGIPPQYVFALMRSAFVQTEYETKKGSNKKKCLGFRSPSEIAEAFCLDD